MLEIRDETWLVQRVERASDGWFVDVQGLSELVRGTHATFSSAIDEITPLDPSTATVKVDTSARHVESRLWLEATLRKTAIPLTDPTLTVSTQGLVDTLPYSSPRAARRSIRRTCGRGSCWPTRSALARRSRSG